MPFNDITAATAIQSAWRAHRMRNNLKLEKPDYQTRQSGFKTFVSSNEPDPSFLENPIKGHFVFVGTSAFRNLDWIQQIAKVPPQSKDGFTGIPKLYIVDNSCSVEEFWAQIKAIFVASKTPTEFHKNVLIARDKFRSCCAGDYGVADQIIHHIEALISNKNATPQEWYEYFRSIVIKSTFISADWENRRVFENIRASTDSNVPIVAYASNIVEYVGLDQTSESDASLKIILENIDLLQSKYVFHTRTTLQKANTGRRLQLQPDTLLINPTVAQLYDKKYSPMDTATYRQFMSSQLQDLETLSLFELMALLTPSNASGATQCPVRSSVPPKSTTPPVEQENQEDKNICFAGLKKGFFNTSNQTKTIVKKPPTKNAGNFGGFKKGFLN